MKSEEHHHKKWEIDNFKIKIVILLVNFGRNSIITNGQMQVKKRGFSVRGISSIELKLCIVNLTYHIVKINIIRVGGHVFFFVWIHCMDVQIHCMDVGIYCTDILIEFN